MSKNSQKIKAVIFDLGSVLLKMENDNESLYETISQVSKIPVKRIKAIYKEISKKLDIGKIDEKEFWKQFEFKIGKKLPENFKKDLFIKDYKRKCRKEIKGSWRILRKLKSKRIRLAILSNTIEPHVRTNKEMGRLKKLRKIGVGYFVWSYEVGARKPDPKIYKIILKKLNLKPKFCVFVDDDLKNVKTARKLGMKGIVFKMPKQLEKELTNFGLL